MKTGKKELAVCILFWGGLLLMLVLFVLLPKKEFSEKEKRYLESVPEINLDDIISGQFADQAENAAADHLPGRDFLLELNAYADMTLNLQATKDIYVGHSGRLYERPYEYDEESADRNMQAINNFAREVDQEVSLMIVPSAGFFMHDDIVGLADPYEDDNIIPTLYGMADPSLRLISVLDEFMNNANQSELYYKTDHHWTSEGAYTASCKFLTSLGKTALLPEQYNISEISNFRGTTYSRSCFWNTPAESLQLWDDGNTYTVTFSDKDGSYEGLFFDEHLDEMDKYPVWLDGNHPLVRIENNSADANGTLLVIKDSFANCFAGFTAQAYKTVILVDLRYYKLSVSDLCASENVDDILIMYYIGNFLTDSNIVWLE